MKGKSDSYLRSFLLLACFLPTCYTSLLGQLSGSYTIDPSMPASATNYTSFGSAISDLHSLGISSDVTFVVATGTYTEQLTINAITGASNTKQVRFTSATGNASDVRLQFAGTATDNFTLLIDGASHVIFSEIHLKALGATYAHVLVLKNDADNNLFQNCTLEGKALSSSTSNTDAITVYCRQGSGASPDGNVFRRNTIMNGSWGMYFRADGSAVDIRGTLIENNTLMNQAWIGVYFFSTDGNTLRGNRFFSNNIGVGIWINSSNNNEDWEINNNLLVVGKTGGGSVVGMDLSIGSSSRQVMIANNMIRVFQTGTGIAKGIEYSYVRNAYFYYNTIKVEMGNSASSLAIDDVTPSLTGSLGLRFLNNIFSNETGGKVWKFRVDPSGYLHTIDYNMYHATGGADLADWDGTPVPDINSMRTQTGQDAHSTFRDPELTLHLGLPIVDGTASNLSDFTATPVSISEDYYGNTRDISAPFLGASEYHTLDVFFPVEWLFVKAQPKEVGIQLTWATASESSNDYFVVQKSTDGLAWQEMAHIPSLGDSQSPQYYEWWDISPFSGPVYYRLVQTDVAGRESLSSVVEAHNPGQVRFQAYPNPASSYVDLQFPMHISKLRLFDMRGALLAEKDIGNERFIRWQRKGLRPGMYFLVAYSRKGSYMKKILFL